MKHTAMDSETIRLQHYIDRVARGEPVDVVLREIASLPDRGDLGALVALAARLHDVLPTAAPAQFRARLQADLQAEFGARRRRVRSVGPAWLGGAHVAGRLAPLLAAAVLAIGLSLGTTVGLSASSLPGDTLYGVKRAAENVRLTLAWTATGRARVRLDIARARIEEVQKLIENNMPVSAALVDTLTLAHRDLLEAVRDAGDPALIATAASAVSEHRHALSDLAARADPRDQPLIRGAADALGRIASEAERERKSRAGAAGEPPPMAATASPAATPASPAAGDAVSLTRVPTEAATHSPPAAQTVPPRPASPTADLLVPTPTRTLAPPSSRPDEPRPTSPPMEPPTTEPAAPPVNRAATRRAEDLATRQAEQAAAEARQTARAAAAQATADARAATRQAHPTARPSDPPPTPEPTRPLARPPDRPPLTPDPPATAETTPPP